MENKIIQFDEPICYDNENQDYVVLFFSMIHSAVTWGKMGVVHDLGLRNNGSFIFKYKVNILDLESVMPDKVEYIMRQPNLLFFS